MLFLFKPLLISLFPEKGQVSGLDPPQIDSLRMSFFAHMQTYCACAYVHMCVCECMCMCICMCVCMRFQLGHMSTLCYDRPINLHSFWVFRIGGPATKKNESMEVMHIITFDCLSSLEERVIGMHLFSGSSILGSDGDEQWCPIN